MTKLIDINYVTLAILVGVGLRTVLGYMRVRSKAAKTIAKVEAEAQTTADIEIPDFDPKFINTAIFSTGIAYGFIAFVLMKATPVPNDTFILLCAGASGCTINEILNRAIGH